MFETVVVGADGSPTAGKAFQYALELVKVSGGTLHIVLAYKRSATGTGGGADRGWLAACS